ncbi:hypothetical protein B0H14DRAFT_2800946 [Mycena olivaceomarginata]|nr:hypothetical protein B0H14DRAFT_2800946 [Mycena olivaceomarginata]
MGVLTEDKFSISVGDLGASAITSPQVQESWIRGSRGELLVWVPPEYRRHLHLSPCFIVIAPVRVVVDMGPCVHGTDWVTCYTP